MVCGGRLALVGAKPGGFRLVADAPTPGLYVPIEHGEVKLDCFCALFASPFGNIGKGKKPRGEDKSIACGKEVGILAEGIVKSLEIADRRAILPPPDRC